MTQDGELRATSDLMLTMLERLRAAEMAKRGLQPGSGEFASLAYDVVELARTVVRWSELQLRQANEALARPGGPTSAPLVDVRPRRLDEVLAEWRQAEIRLSQSRPGSDEALACAQDAERLRLEYGELQARKLADHARNA